MVDVEVVDGGKGSDEVSVGWLFAGWPWEGSCGAEDLGLGLRIMEWGAGVGSGWGSGVGSEGISMMSGK